MAFPEDVLTADERVVLHLRPHWKAAVRPALVFLVAVAAAVAAYVLLPDSEGGRIGVLATAGVALVFMPTKVIWPLLVWRCTHYVVTDERVLLQSGVVSRDRRDLPLARVNDHAMRQNLLDRILGCGTLTIDSLGEQGPVVLTGVPGVTRVQNTLYELIEADRDRPDREDEGDGAETSAGQRSG